MLHRKVHFTHAWALSRRLKILQNNNKADIQVNAKLKNVASLLSRISLTYIFNLSFHCVVDEIKHRVTGWNEPIFYDKFCKNVNCSHSFYKSRRKTHFISIHLYANGRKNAAASSVVTETPETHTASCI